MVRTKKSEEDEEVEKEAEGRREEDREGGGEREDARARFARVSVCRCVRA